MACNREVIIRFDTRQKCVPKCISLSQREFKSEEKSVFSVSHGIGGGGGRGTPNIPFEVHG